MRHTALRGLLSLLLVGVGSAVATADVVRVAPRVTPWVVLRAAPHDTSARLGTLRHGEEVPLISTTSDGLWHQVRHPEPSVQRAFVSAIHTVVLRAPEGIPPPPVTMPLGLPPIEDGALPIKVVKGLDEEKLFGWIPKDALASIVVAACSVGLLFYSVLMANTRGRNDTFRQLRERFETLRGTAGFSEALKTAPKGVGDEKVLNSDAYKVIEALTDPDAGHRAERRARLLEEFLGKMAAALQGPLPDDTVRNGVIGMLRQSLSSTEPDKPSEAEAWKQTIKLQESYWVRAFDEWYITTGGRWVFKRPPGKFMRWVKRTFGVYRALWDEYYREAISNTVNDNPMMMLSLWHAYSGGHTGMDMAFVKDMWDITKEHHGDVDAALTHWAGLRKADEQLPEVKKPSFLTNGRLRQFPAGYRWLLTFSLILLALSAWALIAGGMVGFGMIAGVGAAALIVCLTAYYFSDTSS